MSETTNNRFHITTTGYVFKQHCSTLIDTVQVGYYIESYFRNLQEKQSTGRPSHNFLKRNSITCKTCQL